MTTPDNLAAAREALRRTCDAPSSVTVYETMETVEIVSAVPVAYIRAILAALDGHADALSAARREGAAEAFERVKRVAVQVRIEAGDIEMVDDDQGPFLSPAFVAKVEAAAIRALERDAKR